MQLTAIPHKDAVVNHHSGMHHTIRPDAAASADADPGTDRRACPNHSPLIDHSRWMNLGRWPAAWNQLIQSFRKGQARVGEHRKGNLTLNRTINQILLIRQQKSPNTALPQL